MPSSQLTPDNDAIDTEYLARMTLGDRGLAREVLGMFSTQACALIGTLAALPADAGALAHTLKGSARAIGARRVADSAAALETAIINGDDPSQALTELQGSVAEARASIDAILRRC